MSILHHCPYFRKCAGLLVAIVVSLGDVIQIDVLGFSFWQCWEISEPWLSEAQVLPLGFLSTVPKEHSGSPGGNAH